MASVLRAATPGSVRSPRDWLRTPEHFGKADDPAFRARPKGAEQRSDRAAAFVFHRFSLGVQRALDAASPPLRQADLADLIEMNGRLLNQKLRGHREFRTAEMIGIARVLGSVDLWPVADNLDDLEPK